MLWLLLLVPVAIAAGEPLSGRPVAQVLEEFRNDGLPLVYSTALVDDTMIVQREPDAADAAERVREMLEPYGLTLVRSGDSYLVVRQEDDAGFVPADIDPAIPGADVLEGPLELERLGITASRYVLYSNSLFYIDQRAIQALPDLGEDPIRSAQRLPGTAASGLSSRSHFRGGEHNETAIYLNGLKLLEPFHIRDYHSIFSSIDARAISGIEAYTGGFPADFGDQMSGVLVLESMRPEEPLNSEFGLSVYNTSLLNSGYAAGGRFDWLVSARRSNLGLVLAPDVGEPEYFDVFAQAGLELNDRHRLSFNAMYADDQVVVTTESDPEELEQSVSNVKNTHLWLALESQWGAFLSSYTAVAYSGFDNSRHADSNDPEQLLALVDDQRDAEILAINQDWEYAAPANHLLGFGLAVRHESARYDYRGHAEYRGFYQFYPGVENPLDRIVQASPEGNSYSMYLSDRWQFAESAALELGLRWDRQRYTGVDFDDQWSPRISFLQSLGEGSDLRLTWGRYYQSQGIHQLQVEDGIDRFFAPQRADHWIAGLQHRFENGYRLRLEAYVKDYSRLRPRFENLFDPLVLIPELSPDRVMLAPESARAAGVETTFEYRGGNSLDWWFTYAWSRVTDRIGGATQRRSWDQRHAVQAGLAWQSGLWEVGLAINVHTGWPTTGLMFEVVPAGEDSGDSEGEEEDLILPVPGPRNAEQLDTFAQLDFRVSREFPVRHGRLSAFFEVTNATNRKNECCVEYDIDEDPDGEPVLDVVVEHWLPIIPAVGILWEF